MSDLEAQRTAIRPLLDESSPNDAMASYYALHHDPARTRLFIHYDENRKATGMLVRAQTGLDLFRPLVIVRAQDQEAVISLLHVGLQPGRPYYVTMPPDFGDVAFKELQVETPEVLRLYALDVARFQPEINVLVTSLAAADGLPRFEIRQGDKQMAMAGVNWKTDRFAELHVFVETAARGRGWGRAVVSALTNRLLEQRVRPLYVVSENNTDSIRLAERVGFADTQAREFSCFAVLEPPESKHGEAHG